MRFHYYHKHSGVLHTRIVMTSVDDEKAGMLFALRNTPVDHLPVAGCLDHRCHTVDVATGKVVVNKVITSAPRVVETT